MREWNDDQVGTFRACRRDSGSGQRQARKPTRGKSEEITNTLKKTGDAHVQAIQACKHTGIQASIASKQTYMHEKGNEDKGMERLFNTARPQTALARVCPEVLGHCMWCHVSVRFSVALSPPETHMQATKSTSSIRRQLDYGSWPMVWNSEVECAG